MHELIARRKPVRHVGREHVESLKPLEKLACKITDKIGTMGFFIIIVVWTVFWLGWNSLAPHNLRFDPPMGFVFWLFISNMIQIFLMPLIMIGQNVQGKHADLRSQSDFEVNIKAEREIEAVLRHLEYQNSVLRAIAEKNGVLLEEIRGSIGHADGA